MKHISNLLRRFRQGFAPRQGKKGSSLGLVMIIGAVLVIWVMAIMPMMVATGNAAYGVQGAQEDYLDSRSAIEFAKSELERIVINKVPYTFAVIRNDDGTYRAMAKKDINEPGTQYSSYVTSLSSDDCDDVPMDNDLGGKVAAICAVTTDDGSKYDIAITTYNRGEEGLSYSATYTLTGSLLIYPEAYAQSQALPLSDFVLVDGLLGSRQVWKSTISGVTDTSFEEYLLPWKLDPEASYANSGEYPAVLKTTALPADGASASFGTPIDETFTSDDEWVFPTVKSGAADTRGEIWIEDGKVYMYVDSSNTKVEVTDLATIYYNGNVNKPEGTCVSYNVTLDFAGMAEHFVMPAQGLQLESVKNNPADIERSVSNAKIEKIQYGSGSNGGTLTVLVTNINGIKVGYCADGEQQVTWDSEYIPVGGYSIAGLPADQAYHIYCYLPESFNNGVYYAASEVKYLGTVFPFEPATSLEHESDYLVLGKDSNDYYALSCSSSSEAASLGKTEFTTYYGSLGNGVAYISDAGTLEDVTWNMVKKNPTNNNSSEWRFKNTQVTTNGTTETETAYYLTMAKSNSGSNKGDKGDKGGSYTLSLTTDISGDNGVFNVNIENGGNAKAYRKTDGENRYLKYKDNKWNASTESGDIYFVKLPGAAPEVTVPANPVTTANIELTYGASKTKLIEKIEEATSLDVTDVYCNGSNAFALNAGVYSYTATTNGGGYVVGIVTVKRAALFTDSLTLAVDKTVGDELTVKVSGGNWLSNGGAYYIGYRAVSSGISQDEINALSASDFSWVSTTNGSYEFRLNYGSYIFAVTQSNTTNHTVGGVKKSAEVALTATQIGQLTEEDRSAFKFSYNKETGEVTWYDSLPAGLFPSKITLVFGVPVGTDDISWSYTYTDDVRFYGAIIAGSDYKDLNSVYQLNQPIKGNVVNGYATSMLRGSSLYFMGENYSINTYGNEIVLTTDLLVLNHPITGGGSVYVEPYSTGEDDPGDTLLFVVHDVGNFKEKNFYKVPANTDLNNVSVAKAEAMLVKSSSGNGTSISVDASGNITNIEFADNVKGYFRRGVYPDVNLDIAYADKDQLAAIVSGETIKWTSGGVLKNSDTSIDNSAYVVCAYVTQSNGGSYLANRILIAAKAASDGTNTLYVPSTLKLTTRYLSLEADNIVQQNGSSFMLYSLGQNDNIISKFSNALGLTNYSSKTLQVDYERYTIIQANGTEKRYKPQICRYEDGKDLFEVEPQDLMVTYTVDEIEELFDGGLSFLGSTVQIVDRYVKITDDSGSNSTLDVGSLFSCTLKMYANYIYIDPSVDQISVVSLLTSGSVLVNSQEYGYTAQEYLNLFQYNSAESYSGTLVYLADSVKIKYNYFQNPVTVNPGFYYIGASSKGINITELKDKTPLSLDILKNYSVYIDPNTGKFSSAYVDTGIYTNAGTGLGGFSGGNVG